MQYPVITYGMAFYINCSIPTKHWHWENLCMCERRKFSHFYILKLLFLSIFCWYFRYFVGKLHACRLTCTDKFPNVPTKLRKSIMGGNCPPAPPPPPPPPLATIMNYQEKRKARFLRSGWLWSDINPIWHMSYHVCVFFFFWPTSFQIAGVHK